MWPCPCRIAKHEAAISRNPNACAADADLATRSRRLAYLRRTSGESVASHSSLRSRPGIIFRDPTRRAILERLSRRPASASALAAPLRVTVAAVVQHLQVLEASGLIRTEKVGRVRSCEVRPEGLRVLERWIAERRAAWLDRFDRLERILDEGKDG